MYATRRQYVAGIVATLPPSTRSTPPFTNAPARLARYNIVPAMSCSAPARSAGW